MNKNTFFAEGFIHLVRNLLYESLTPFKRSIFKIADNIGTMRFINCSFHSVKMEEAFISFRIFRTVSFWQLIMEINS